MKEHSVIFTSDEVRATLAGRKTQFRRPVKPQPPDYVEGAWNTESGKYDFWAVNGGMEVKCPYATYGEENELWVREAWRIVSWYEGEPYTLQYKQDMSEGEDYSCGYDYDEDRYYQYAKECNRDCEIARLETDADGCYSFDITNAPTRWRLAVHMPRWASRIQLSVKNVRVERLQDITEEDAKAEGVGRPSYDWGDGVTFIPTETTEFSKVWEEEYAKKGFGWDKNPWVWVIDFEVKK